MSDVYRVAVALQMSSNHSAVLGALASSLIGAHHHVTKLNKGLAETSGAMTRMKLALGGGLALAGGTAILATLKNITDHTRDLSKELATLKTQGLTRLQVKGADKAAQAATMAVPGSTESGNLKLLSEANSLMGIENAKRALPSIARAVQVLGAIDGNYKQAQESLYSALKSGEMLGKLLDEKTHLIDPGKLDSFLNVIARVSAATGNRVNAQTMFGMVQQGAPALANMNDDGLMAMLMAAQQMGGPRAGTALSSMYQQFVGGTMTEARAKELKRLNLVGDYDVGRGGHLTFHKGALETPFVKALEKNPLDAMKILQGSLAKGGFKDIESQTKELFMIMGRQTTQRLVSDFLRNMPNMMAEQGRIKLGQGLDAQAKTRNNEDYAVVEHNMHEAWTNLMEAIGGPQSKAAITVMNQITGGLNYLTTTVRGMNPETLVSVGKGLAVMGGALTAGGAVALLAALGPAGWIVGGIAALGAGVVAFKPQIEAIVASIAPFAAKLEEFKTKTYAAIAEFTPKLVAEVASWPGRLAASITAMGEALVTMLGDMLKNLIAKLNPFSRTSFEGGGGLGGMIQKASFSTGGGANDNFGGASGRGSGSITGPLGGAPTAGLKGDVRAYVRAAALARGIDPNVAERVINQESGFNPNRNNLTSREQSYGVMQLNTQGGLGAVAMRQGINPRDPSQWRKHIDFGLDVVKRDGWRQWYGARDVGIGRWQGVGGTPKAAPTAGPPPRREQTVHVHNLVVDGKKMAAVVSTHQADGMLFPKKAGGMDTHGQWRAPGTPVMDAA